MQYWESIKVKLIYIDMNSAALVALKVPLCCPSMR